MRELTPDGPFDAVVNWFTSFGWFDDATDRALLVAWRRALGPGGKLVMDLQNLQRLLTLMAHTGGQAQRRRKEAARNSHRKRWMYEHPIGQRPAL